MFASSFGLVIAAAFPALVLVAAIKDITSYTIPNWISLALLAAFAPAALAAHMNWSDVGVCLIVGFVALLAGVFMFAMNWCGGGDAKLLAAAALWLGLPGLPTYLLATGLAGGVLSIGLLAMRQHLPAAARFGPTWVGKLMEPKGPLPYGLAIAAGALFAFPQSALFRTLASGS